MVLRWVPLILLLGLAAASPITSGATAEDPDTLYLLPSHEVRQTYNFTTNGSGIPETPVFPHLRNSTASSWFWEMGQVPADWTIPAGGEVAFMFGFTNLDQVVPVYGMPDDPTRVDSIQIRIGLLSGSREPFATETLYHRASPLSDGVTRIEGRFAASEARDVHADAGIFGLRIDVYGQTLADTAAEVIAGGSAPSHVQIAGFPYAAFRAWEDAERTRDECLARVLQQESCPEPDPAPTGEPGGRTVPMVPSGILVLTVAAVVTFVRRVSSGNPRATG